jgi:hypothetical protein
MLRYTLYLDCREGTSIVAENSIDTIDLFRNTQNGRLRRRGRCICPYGLRIWREMLEHELGFEKTARAAPGSQ